MTYFEEWLKTETKLGLVDIKLSVYNSKSATVYAVKEELLKTEAMISAGLVSSAPYATTFLPKHIQNIVDTNTHLDIKC